METYKLLNLLILFFLYTLIYFTISACAPAQTSMSKTFQEPSQQCVDSAIKTRFLVTFEDGSVMVEEAQSKEALFKKYENIHGQIQKVKLVEYDFQLKIDIGGELRPQAEAGNWGIENTNAASLWNKNILGQDVLVAIVDSGIDINHSQLIGRLAYNDAELNGQKNVDDDNNGFVDDVLSWNFATRNNDVRDTVGHGTHVAGIIAADHTTNDLLPKGVAPKAKILPITFIDKSGGGSISAAIAAIDYAKTRGAKVINASWGGGVCSNTLKQKIESLSSQGILFVAAAGNDGTNIDQFYEYPASLNLSNQITVGANTFANQIADFSNFGSRVHLLAPGQDILSTYPGNETRLMSGTSMATPFVTGAVALLISAFPNASFEKIKSAIMSSTDPYLFPVETRGKLNIGAAYSYLQNN